MCARMVSIKLHPRINGTHHSPYTLAVPCVDGIYLPKEENEFVHHVTDELDRYQEKGNHSRLRYLIHKTIEDLPELTTFSVGENWFRRVVVCYSELRVAKEDERELESNNATCEQILRRKKEMEQSAKPKSSIPCRNRTPKRPDKALYMPRAARERLSLKHSQGSTACTESSDACLHCDTTDGTHTSFTFRQESQPNVDSIVNHTTESSICGPQEEDSVLDQSISCFSDMTLEDCEKDREYIETVPCMSQTEDSTTDAADVTLTEEIKANLKEAVVFSIEHVQNDFSIYENVCINQDDFHHVIEIYDFPPMFKTDDLLDAFAEYSEGGMKIKWVDNTHALGVFSSDLAALHALSICHPLLKVRALAEGSKKAKGKAIRRAEFIQPVKERPRTDSAVARRMVTRALGLRGRGQVRRY